MFLGPVKYREVPYLGLYIRLEPRIFSAVKTLKGQWREMVFLTISLYPRYRIRIFKFFGFLSNFGFI
jgi:hypothetical protein